MSLIAFGFRKATLDGDGRALWSLGGFRTSSWALRRISYNWFSAGWYVRTSVILSLTSLSHIWNETVLSTNFMLSISESTRSFLYPRFNKHRLIAYVEHKQLIILNLTTCLYAIDHFYTWHDMTDCEGTGAYQMVYSINLFLTYCQLSLQWHLKS